MAMRSTQNTYPIALGIRITGVDDSTFSQTGEAYSTIALPSMDSHTALTLQEDDTALAYEAFDYYSNPPHYTRLSMLVCSHPACCLGSLRASSRL